MKNNMDYFKTMNEKDLDLTKTAVDWTDKAFRGNGDCAAIARTTGKTCKVVLRDGEDTSFLEGIHAFLLKNGKLDAECSWKSENGVENLPIWYSTYVEAQKAVHWVVEKQLMEPESENVFGAQKSVSKLKTLQLMIKTNNLMRAEVQ